MATRLPMAKAYDPKEVESRWYERWLEGGYFAPDPDPSKPTFCIIMPPPNVTGELHLGHALTAAIQDLLTRWHRMRGDATLWLPGRDHAGIAGQLVVERELAAEGKSRHDLGRDAFIERMWAWMNRYGAAIGQQHRRLGVSVDWGRERFTMEPGPSRAVRTAFVRLYDEGLIYRGARITNWCPRCSTALSDLEVVHEEEPGILTYVRYPLVPVEGETERRYIEIATTRPETILADTGIAVHPEDDRLAELVGRTALVPSVDRPIPIVADEVVEREFGTGAVKVTPGHDPTDFEIGQRHSLPTVLVIGADGRMNAQAGPRYEGMLANEARRAFVDELRALGALVKEEPHPHQVGHCDRCKTVVEPLVTEQWYVRIEPLAAAALQSVRAGEIDIIPDRFTKVYFNWLEHIRDWCISRQLWWGHRIPVWTCGNGHVFASVEDPDGCRECGSTELTQDPDVLDTWFSSALWPFSTLGWPDDTDDFRRFYPTTVMETGYDILFFWVARMIMMGLKMTGRVPFRTVYLHGLIRVGREKMSKVKGNVLNPLELIDAYGTDALRLSLVSGTTPGNDTNISTERLETSRNFVNKLWNAGRFLQSAAARWTPRDLRSPLERAPGAPFEADRWIVSRANEVTAHVTRLLEEFQIGEAVRTVHDFLWGEFCDWYLEIAKIELRIAESDEERDAIRTNLVWVFEHTLRLLHPMSPFVTEELWQTLVHGNAHDSTQRANASVPPSVMIAPWPAAGGRDLEAEARVEAIIALARGIRNLRAEYHVDASRWAAAVLVAEQDVDFFERSAAIIGELPGVRLRPITVVDRVATLPEHAASIVAGGATIYVPLAGIVDVDRERARLERERDDVQREIERAETLLGRPGFVDRAPAEVVTREREKSATLRDRLAKLESLLEQLRA
ncbi:MAG TPA: valine--tRNA ligase [Chloroflexota bacterium]|nr:valine--tRNA ligase [Chloroflexota bacterium]